MDLRTVVETCCELKKISSYLSTSYTISNKVFASKGTVLAIITASRGWPSKDLTEISLPFSYLSINSQPSLLNNCWIVDWPNVIEQLKIKSNERIFLSMLMIIMCC